MEAWSALDQEIDGCLFDAATFASDVGEPGEKQVWRFLYSAARRSVQRVGWAMVEAMEAAQDPQSTVNIYGYKDAKASLPEVGDWQPEACRGRTGWCSG